MRILLILATVVITACGATASDGGRSTSDSVSQPVPAHPVVAELIADVASIRPGQIFHVGVRLKMQRAWHVYWKNPGDSGLPVALEPVGPAGFTFGDMKWPLPIEFDQPGDIAGYGYTDVVMFPLQVQASSSIAPGSTARLTVKASWLACRDVCIPGGETIEITLPVAASSTPANTEVFSDWQAKLPTTDRLAAVTTEGSIGTGSIVMRLQWNEPVRSVQFFPVPEAALNVSNVTIEHRERSTVIRFAASVLSGQKLQSEELDTLVVATDVRGTRRGIEVPVRLGGGATAAPSAKRQGGR